MNPGFTAETSAQITANQITAPEFHSYRCKHCSPAADLTISLKNASHMCGYRCLDVSKIWKR